MTLPDPSTGAGDDAAVLRSTAAGYGMEFIPVVADEALDPQLVTDLPVEWARSRYLLPIRVDGEACVVCADPERVTDRENLELLVGVQMRPILCPRTAILNGIERCYFSRDDSPSDFLRGMAETAEAGAGAVRARTDDLLQVAEQAPVTQFINLILLEAVKRRASDIHFEPFEDTLRVRYRVDGILYEQAAPPKQLQDSLVSRLKVMARLDIAEKRLPQDGTAKVRVGEREIDIRVSTVPVAEGERVVLRLLDRASVLLPLDILGMPQGILGRMETLVSQPNGIIVVSGPTGSGKTTTLYAALSRLDASRKNILTVEDPIEYQLPHIGQIQVHAKIGLTFASGLRHILRQDPDIILVGETRDLETAEIAIRASLTGHLVFTTLHTNDAPSAVLRLIDMGVEPYLLAACLRGVLAQRLVRDLCKECRVGDVGTQTDADAVAPYGARLLGRQIWRPRGCPACLEGYSGRTGLFELMLVEDATADLIRQSRASVAELRRTAQGAGMSSLLEDGIDKVLAGVTDLSEIAVTAP